MYVCTYQNSCTRQANANVRICLFLNKIRGASFVACYLCTCVRAERKDFMLIYVHTLNIYTYFCALYLIHTYTELIIQ